MVTAHKISIALTGDLAADIDAAIASGDYATTSEVIRDALRHWKRVRSERDATIAALRTAWADGIAGGDPQPLDVAAVKRAGRAALAASGRRVAA